MGLGEGPPPCALYMKDHNLDIMFFHAFSGCVEARYTLRVHGRSSRAVNAGSVYRALTCNKLNGFAHL